MEDGVQSVAQADTEGETHNTGTHNIDSLVLGSSWSLWKSSLFSEGGEISSTRV